jgi:hypothetical protein
MKGFLKKAFPFLSVAASTFGGPLGMAGAQVLGAALGKDVKPEALEAELNKLILTDEGRLKAQQAEQEFAITMRKLGFEHVEELERIAASDRASAREREVKVKDKMPFILSLSVNVMFFGVIIALVYRAVPADSKDVILILLGALTAGWKDVLGYYFGSSAGSAAKTEILDKHQEKLAGLGLGS